MEAPPVLSGVALFGDLVSQHRQSSSVSEFQPLAPFPPTFSTRLLVVVRELVHLERILLFVVLVHLSICLGFCDREKRAEIVRKKVVAPVSSGTTTTVSSTKKNA